MDEQIEQLKLVGEGIWHVYQIQVDGSGNHAVERVAVVQGSYVDDDFVARPMVVAHAGDGLFSRADTVDVVWVKTAVAWPLTPKLLARYAYERFFNADAQSAVPVSVYTVPDAPVLRPSWDTGAPVGNAVLDEPDWADLCPPPGTPSPGQVGGGIWQTFKYVDANDHELVAVVRGIDLENEVVPNEVIAVGQGVRSLADEDTVAVVWHRTQQAPGTTLTFVDFARKQLQAAMVDVAAILGTDIHDVVKEWTPAAPAFDQVGIDAVLGLDQC